MEFAIRNVERSAHIVLFFKSLRRTRVGQGACVFPKITARTSPCKKIGKKKEAQAQGEETSQSAQWIQLAIRNVERSAHFVCFFSREKKSTERTLSAKLKGKTDRKTQEEHQWIVETSQSAQWMQLAVRNVERSAHFVFFFKRGKKAAPERTLSAKLKGKTNRETQEEHPTDEFDTATVIEVSTRGTLRSDTW